MNALLRPPLPLLSARLQRSAAAASGSRPLHQGLCEVARRRRCASALSPALSASTEGLSTSSCARHGVGEVARRRRRVASAALPDSDDGLASAGDGQPTLASSDPQLMYRVRAQRWLEAIDETGSWTVLSSALAFGTFLLETLNEDRFGGWDVLFRDDLPIQYGVSMSTIAYAEAAVNTLFAAEFGVRAWVSGFSLSFFTSPFNLVDLASASPPLLALLGADVRALRLLRVFRVLRLLRLLDRDPGSVLFGVLKSDDTSTQLLGVVAEFVCIFCIAAGVMYDLELEANPNVHTLSDTLYWAFLTLTGIGQPFEIVTGPGKVATVVAVLVALVTIPGQLAKLATVSMSANSSRETLLDYMTPEERAVFVASGGKVAPRNAERAAAAGGGGGGGGGGNGGSSGSLGAMGRTQRAVVTAVQQQQQQREREQMAQREQERGALAVATAEPAGMTKLSTGRRFRRTLVAPRVCGTPGCEQLHDLDAQFCKSCGTALSAEVE